MAHSTRYFIRRELERMSGKCQWAIEHGNAVLERLVDYANKCSETGESIPDDLIAAGDGVEIAINALTQLMQAIELLKEKF